MNPLYVLLDIGGVWRMSIFVGMVLVLVGFFRCYWKYLEAEIIALWAYVLVSALMILEFPGTQFGDFQNAFIATSGQTFAEALLIPFVILLLPVQDLQKVWNGFTIFIAMEIALVWINGYGIMMAPSFDTALLAAFLPYCPWYLGIVAIVTILTHHGSTALLIMFVQLSVLAYKERQAILCWMISIPLFGGAAILHNHGPLLNGSERLQQWKMFMSFWWNHGWTVRLFGTGPGSFVWLSMGIENKANNIFLQMHNDWLQVTFELGIVGLILSLLLFYKAIKASWNDPRSLSAIFGLAAFAVTYHPTRFLPTMVLFALIFREALSHGRPIGSKS